MAEKTPMIPIARPTLGEREVEAVRRVILSGWVTQGPEVAAFEREFASFVGAPHAAAVSSGTTALHLALLAAGVGAGDDVVTVSHSFIATANAIRYCGARPAFVDIDPDTFNIDPALIERAITPATKAVLCVHQVGMPCDLRALVPFCRSRRLTLIEDAACAAGSEVLWDGSFERVGRPHGDVACFSFHPRKLLTTGDGGMITTANAGWDAKFRLWRQHGMGVPDTVRHASKTVIFESYTELGYNYRMTDLQAAIGRIQIERLPELVVARRARAERYREKLGVIPGLILPEQPAWAKSNWQTYTVRLPGGREQRSVMQRMLEAGVATRRGVMCAHREPAYAATQSWACGAGPGPCGCALGACARLRESERAQDETLALPLLNEMTDAQQDAVVQALRQALA